MRMQFGTSAFERAIGDLITVPVLNAVAEPDPTEATQIALQSRPGLADLEVNIGSSVDGIFKADGVLDGVTCGVSGTALYVDGVNVGTIDGTGVVSMAGNELGIMVTRGETLWTYDGTALAPVNFPDLAGVIKVFTGASRFWAIRADTGKIYWTPSLDLTFDGLDFATAESLPDKLIDAIWIDDTAVLFGKETVEFWPNTSDDPPIAPLEGRVFSKGIRATGCAAQFGETFAWVGNDNAVYVNGDGPQAISNPGLNAIIADSADCSLWSFEWNGRVFLALRLDTRTFIYGDRWSEFTSYGETNWLAQCYAGGIFGLSDGRTAQWGDALDLGGDMERRWRGGFPINSGGVVVNNILLRCNTGQTTYLSGDHAEPVVEMRLSRDAGKTWGEWRSRSLGVQGEYAKRVQWNGCGMASRPALLAEFRVTSPIDFRVSDVLMNEPMGGR